MTVTPEPLCGARAARCRCAKPAGHVEEGDGVHPDRCTGQWSGTPEEGGNFQMVAIPFPVGEPRPWDDDEPGPLARLALLPIPRSGIRFEVR